MEFNTYEYSAQQKADGKFFVRKMLILSLYFIFTVAYLSFIIYTIIFTLGALIPVALWILIFFTWRYVKPDYKYEIATGMLTFSVKHGNKKKGKVVTEFKVSAAEEILPVAENEEEITAFESKKIYSALPSQSASDVYAALYTDKDVNKCVFYFVATEQALKLLHFYNSRTIVVKTAY